MQLPRTVSVGALPHVNGRCRIGVETGGRSAGLLARKEIGVSFNFISDAFMPEKLLFAAPWPKCELWFGRVID